MPAANTATTYGSVTRTFHWLTALMILTAIPLGLYANGLPFDTGDALAWKAQVFSVHKTLGVAIFVVALARILWALTQMHPVPLHPDKKAETALAALVHWVLYISLVAMPLTGWVEHAASTGFAPILWPLGQDLPFVPKSESVAHLAGTLHWVFSKLLIASVLLHIAGALKHAVIDGDGTLSRMASGMPAGAPHARQPVVAPALSALAIFAAGTATAAYLSVTPAQTAASPTAAPAATTAGNWQVTDGTLGFTINQLGSPVQGSFADWTADITFEDTPGNGPKGQVTVTIDMTSLALGSVTDQAKSKDFFDVTTHPTATFTADIVKDDTGYAALGTLSLHGQNAPVTLPFTLQITGDTATMTAGFPLDRRAFGIGPAYGDEKTVGFNAAVAIALTAKRK